MTKDIFINGELFKAKVPITDKENNYDHKYNDSCPACERLNGVHKIKSRANGLEYEYGQCICGHETLREDIETTIPLSPGELLNEDFNEVFG